MLYSISHGIPLYLLSRCAGVAFCHLISRAAVLCALSANGIVLHRDDGMDEWSPPSIISMGMAEVEVGFALPTIEMVPDIIS